MKQRQYRQGDVFLTETQIPEDGERRKPDGNRYVLAYGEVTGHAHAIADIESVCILETSDGRRFLDVAESVPLTHEEHGTIDVTKGTYEITIQREYSPERVRNVAD